MSNETQTDDFADIAKPAQGGDDFADIAKPQAAAPDFSAGPKNTDGTFQMAGPKGTPVKVPYSRVMEASKAGYKIDPEDRITYAKNREYELKQKGQKLNIATDLPEAYSTLSAAPARGSGIFVGGPFLPSVELPNPAWLKQQALAWSEKTLGLLPTAFGAAGGLLAGGAGLETGPADIAVAGGGAALGGALGESIRQGVEEKVHPYEPKMTPKQALAGIGEQAAIQGGNEVLGRAGAKATAPLAKYFGDTAVLSARTGVPLLPSEAAGKAPSYIEKFLKGSVLTSARMERFRALQNAQTQSEVQRIADGISRFHGTSEDLGDLVQKGIDLHTREFRATQNALYDAIGADVGEQTVKIPIHTQEPTGLVDPAGNPIMRTVTTYKDKQVDKVMPSTIELKKFAADELKKLDQAEQILDPNLLSQSRRMLETIIDAPDNITYKAMASARSDALAKARELDQALAGKQAGLAKKMANLFDESMMDGAEKSGIPGLVDKIRAANAYTANEHRMFEQVLVKRIVDTKKPEAIASLLRRKDIGNQELRDLFELMPQQLHPLVQRQLLVDTMRQSTNLTSKVFNERRFADAIGGIGDDRGRIIFGKNWANVKELSKLLERVNGPTGLGGGSGAALQNLSLIKQILAAAAAAPIAMAAAGHVEAGTLTLLGEVVSFKTMAALLTNPQLSERLIKAFQVGLRISPYAATGAVSMAGGPHKTVKQLREEASHALDKQGSGIGNQGPAKPESPGPQSSAKPYTHIFDEEKGIILPA